MLQLTLHGEELLNVAPRPYQIFGLDFARSHLSILGTCFDLLDQRLFLLLKFDSCLVKFAHCLIEHALVLAQTLGGRYALPKRPFQQLYTVSDGTNAVCQLSLTFMLSTCEKEISMKERERRGKVGVRA